MEQEKISRRILQVSAAKPKFLFKIILKDECLKII